jgi:UDP-N-acetylglucosamine 2-epimerase (non-hydrolysing)
MAPEAETDRIRVMCVVGTRPEVIKMAPVIHELSADPDRFECSVCATGQHREMLDQMLDLFEIEPEHDLHVMTPGQSLTDITRAVLAGMDELLEAERPHWMLVQGDTTTVLASGLAAFYRGVRVAHVEAGLRTFDMGDPFPEELNRKLTGAFADLHFAPTERAADNLRREGVAEETIHVTGNTVIDALNRMAGFEFDPLAAELGAVAADDRRLVLVTIHRKEAIRHGMDDICIALRELSLACKDDLHVVFPVHLNPQVREPVHRNLGDVENVTLLDPVDYQALIWLLRRCHFLITDSGGLQEEAAGVGKPVLVLRDATERPEGILAGSARLIGSRGTHLVEAAQRVLTDDAEYERMVAGTTPCPYGDGHAAERIAQVLATTPSRRGERVAAA